MSMNGKSRSQCGKEAEKVIQHLKIITDRLGLRFSGKKDGEDVTFGSGGRMVIIKPTYYSELEKTRKEVKMGLNFFDETIFSATEKDLETYLDDIESRELKLLFEEPYKKYSQKVRLTCYDCREIFVEKCRALMTRPVYKHRDSLDLYMVNREYKYDVIDYESYIIDKVGSAINNFTRYSDNLKIEIPALDRDALDDNLLLIDKPNGLEESINEMHAQVESIRRKIIRG